MAKLTAADKFFIENNRKMEPKELAKAVEKPLKLVADFLANLPAEVENFTVNHAAKQMNVKENTTIMTGGMAAQIEKIKSKGPDYGKCVQKIRD